MKSQPSTGTMCLVLISVVQSALFAKRQKMDDPVKRAELHVCVLYLTFSNPHYCTVFSLKQYYKVALYCTVFYFIALFLLSEQRKAMGT
jgi:hypothetical protein